MRVHKKVDSHGQGDDACTPLSTLHAHSPKPAGASAAKAMQPPQDTFAAQRSVSPASADSHAVFRMPAGRRAPPCEHAQRLFAKNAILTACQATPSCLKNILLYAQRAAEAIESRPDAIKEPLAAKVQGIAAILAQSKTLYVRLTAAQDDASQEAVHAQVLNMLKAIYGQQSGLSASECETTFDWQRVTMMREFTMMELLVAAHLMLNLPHAKRARAYIVTLHNLNQQLAGSVKSISDSLNQKYRKALKCAAWLQKAPYLGQAVAEMHQALLTEEARQDEVFATMLRDPTSAHVRAGLLHLRALCDAASASSATIAKQAAALPEDMRAAMLGAVEAQRRSGCLLAELQQQYAESEQIIDASKKVNRRKLFAAARTQARLSTPVQQGVSSEGGALCQVYATGNARLGSLNQDLLVKIAGTTAHMRPNLTSLRDHLQSLAEVDVPLPFFLPATIIEEAAQLRQALREVLAATDRAENAIKVNKRLADLQALAEMIDIGARADDVLWVQMRHLLAHADALRELHQDVEALRPEVRRLHKTWRRQNPPSPQVADADQGPSPPPCNDAAKQALTLQSHPPCGAPVRQLFALPPDREASLRDFVEQHMDRGTFASAWDSALYHYNKHAKNVPGATMRRYIQRALAARDEHTHLVTRRISDPNEFIYVVDSPQTFLLFSNEGRVVSYRDRTTTRYACESKQTPLCAVSSH